MNVYLVQHLHLINGDEECTKIIGIFSGQEEALLAIDQATAKPGFKEYPTLIDPKKDENIEGFYIDKYEVNDRMWQDGFTNF